MSKYIDAEKLIAEIERQQRRVILLAHTEQVSVRRDCALQNATYSYILSVIASLQQEQPEVELKPIWHKVAEETPTEIGAEVVVACRNKNKECGIWLYDLIQCWEGEWKPRVNWETPIRWAYVRDLDSERKEK